VFIERWVGRWFRSKNAVKVAPRQPGGVSVSQTSVEAEPRARVILYEFEPEPEFSL